MGSEFDSWPVAPDAALARDAANGRTPIEPTWVEMIDGGTSAEDEIGDILVKVQQFADETADEAERESQSIISAAHEKASRLVDEATGQARSIIESAQRTADQIAESSRFDAARSAANPPVAPISREAITELSSAINEYASTNRDLIGELVQLRDALTASMDRSPIGPSGVPVVAPAPIVGMPSAGGPAHAGAPLFTPMATGAATPLSTLPPPDGRDAPR